MRREKQYDMFDVAIGACTLEDYLFQRYSENDLSSTFWIEEKDEVDELRAPKPLPDGRPGTEPVIVPIQGPRAEKNKPKPSGPPPPPEGLKPDKVPADRPGQVPLPTATPPQPQQQQPAADGMDTLQKRSAPDTPSMENFQQSKPVTAPSLETFESSTPEPEESAAGEPDASAPKPPSMEELMAKFHQATKEYKERAGTDDSDAPDDETATE